MWKVQFVSDRSDEPTLSEFIARMANVVRGNLKIAA